MEDLQITIKLSINKLDLIDDVENEGTLLDMYLTDAKYEIYDKVKYEDYDKMKEIEVEIQ